MSKEKSILSKFFQTKAQKEKEERQKINEELQRQKNYEPRFNFNHNKPDTEKEIIEEKTKVKPETIEEVVKENVSEIVEEKTKVKPEVKTIEKTKKKKDSNQIKFRVSDEEYKNLKKIADILSLSVPNFCKNTSQKKKIKSPKIDKEGALEIAKELKKIGTNVNQIAKKLNQNFGVEKSESELEEVRKELGKIWQRLS